MKLTNLAQAIEALRKVVGRDPVGKKIKLEKERTLEFEWGFVFWLDVPPISKWRGPVLVDKIDGSIHSDWYFDQVFDSWLEEYRISKAYPHAIKFPITEDLTDKPIWYKVKALFNTGEIFQIKQGIELIEHHKLIDLNLLKKLVDTELSESWTFEEYIEDTFATKILVLNSSMVGNTLPENLEIFSDFVCVILEEVKSFNITDCLLKFPEMVELAIRNSEINWITPKILDHPKLSALDITDSVFSTQAKEVLMKLKNKGVRMNYDEF